MWFDADNRPDAAEDDDQDERYPFYPVETGHPLMAMLAVTCLAGFVCALVLLTTP